ncbi:unnamed protein product [Rhodiola kirilowii]
MEIRSLKCQTVTAVPACLIRRDLIGKSFVNGRVFRSFKSDYRNLKFSKIRISSVRSQTSGAKRSVIVASVPDIVEKDEDLVFVAGATGRVGSRTVRELLKLGFRVRAGVRIPRKQKLLVSRKFKMLARQFSVRNSAIERLELVECDLEKPETIGPALGNSSVVICCIGASEKEVFDVSGPYRIDYMATKNLVDAAAVAKVKHFIMVSSLGTNKIGFPAAILNLFWGVLLWKRKAEEALIASGIPYTIVRPGGMERPTDSYKETHNITLSQEDTLFGGQVSNLQVAELMAFMAKNRRLSYCKVVEVIAETTAPLCPMDELLLKIPYQRVPPEELEATVGSSPEPPKESAPEPPSDLEEESVEVTTLDSLPEPESATIEVKPVEENSTITRPLSPFTTYEDLKPPTSPSPSPLRSIPAAVKADSDYVPSTTTTPEAPIVSVVEELALTDTLSPEAVMATSPDIAVPNVIDGAAVKSISADGQTSVARPLSPCTMYEDLKPPSSPSPFPTGSKNLPETASPPIQTLTERPVSVSSSIPEQASSLANGDSGTAQDTSKQEALGPQLIISPLIMRNYEDLKPPTSPSPASPPTSSSILPSSSPNGGIAVAPITTTTFIEVVSAEAPGPAQLTEEVLYSKPKSSPLSPFTMYDDLKPPSSPVPSPAKV